MPSQFDLDTPLFNFPSQSGGTTWTIREAVEGCQIFGGIGSGKSSGSGRAIAHKYLLHGFGGLVLTAKAEEKQDWVSYCQQTNRLDDLIILEPGGKERFNFLEYESMDKDSNKSYTENIVEVLKTVIRSSEEKTSGRSDDAFWEGALDMLIFNAVDLCLIAYGKVTVQMLYDIAMSAPKKGETKSANTQNTSTETKPKNQTSENPDEKEAGHSERDSKKAAKPKTAFEQAYYMASQKIRMQILKWEKSLKEGGIKALRDKGVYIEALCDALPDARLFRIVDQFFNENYRVLSEKTRSIIEFSFSGFLFRLLKEPVHSLFANKPSTFTPEDSLKGKIILINLPVKRYNKVGRDCQVLFKYIWQRAMEKRNIAENDRPVFLFADESQHFLHEYDAEYQATARSSRICTVYLSQNIPNYYANMGGTKYESKVKAFLGTLGTKIFHSNADIDTNKYASEMIGDAYVEDITNSEGIIGNLSAGKSSKFILERIVRPENFIGLRGGGPLNNYQVQAYVFMQNKPFANGRNHQKITFKQA